MRQIDSILPDYLKAPPRPTEVPVSPDSTSNSNIVRPSLPMEQDSGADSTQIAESPDPDLACSELLSNDSTLCTGSEDESGYFGASSNSAEKGITTTKQRSDSGETSSSSGSRSSSPLSAVDIFTDFSTNVLQRAYAEVEAAQQAAAASPVDPTYTILVS